MKKSFALFALMFVAYTCEQYPTDSMIGEKIGQLSIKMEITSIPAEVTQVSGMLIKPTMDTIFFDFEIGDNQAVASVEGIPVGTWTLRVDARNSEGLIVYSGTTEVQIIGGEVTSVQLHLSKTGSLDIAVTWGSDTDLVAYYPFDGNANDESGYENHGIVHGATLTEDRFGNPNRAYRFDGIDDYISVANSPSLQLPSSEVTITAWVYINDWDNGWASIVDKSNTAIDGQYGLQFLNGGHFECYVNNCCISIQTSFEFPLKKWWFSSMTYDGTQIKVFADGILIDTLSVSCSPGTNSAPLLIGKDTPGLTEHHNGKLDEIRIYDRALSETEIYSLYQ